jgi:hypothetical protein
MPNFFYFFSFLSIHVPHPVVVHVCHLLDNTTASMGRRQQREAWEDEECLDYNKDGIPL